MKKTVSLSLMACAFLGTLNAQESITLSPLSITSTAIATDELQAADAVEVYTSEDIKKAHVQNIYEFFNEQTSLFAASGYGNPFLQKIDMRGYGIGDGYQNIVITLNGRRMNNVDMVPQLLASIAPESIEKIEIIKSSGIVLGGDGANAGVINITTKKTNNAEISLYGGTYNTKDASFYLGSHSDTLSVSLSGEAQRNGGIRHIDANGAKDANSFATFNLALSYKPLSVLELRADAMTTSTDVIYAGYLTLDEYEANPTQMGATNWGATHQTYTSNLLSLGSSYSFTDTLTLSLDVTKERKESHYLTYSSIYNYEYDSFKASLDYESERFSMSAGVDGFSGKLTKEGSILDLEKTNHAAFVMTQINQGDFSIKAGARYEQIDFTSATGDDADEGLYGAELGVNYLLNKEQSIFFNYAHSYENASLDRLFRFSTGAYIGYVKPSQANSFTLGYNNITPSNKLKISAFYVDLQDEIYYYADPTYVNSRNTNIDASHKYGLDFYDKYLLLESLSFVLNYNYVQAIIDKEVENGETYSKSHLPGVSDHTIKATLSYMPSDYATLALTQIYRSEAYAANDFANNFAQKQDAFTTTDLSATYAKDNWEVFAKINNLFNQKNGLWITDDAIYPINFTTTAIAGLKLKY
jgi:iron complex outermembrane receptor protein